MSRIVAWALGAALSMAACTASGSAVPPPEPSPTVDADARNGAVAANAAPTANATPKVVRLVTLGDAYTHGTETAAPRRDSWPAQLAESLERGGLTVVLYNLAESGDTSGDLLDEQLAQVEPFEPDLVTVQVGVNDIIASETGLYQENVALIMDRLLAFLPATRIFAITTPDHSLTEWGHRRYGSARAAGASVADLNATLRDVADARSIRVIDIGQINELVTDDPSLVVQQDPPLPYPTAKQYAGWAEVIGPHLRGALAAIEP